jgi:DNA repair protein RecO (recombination protein O)
MGGRLDLFVVNDLQLQRGRDLDQILQGELLYSFSRLSRDLGRLGSAQYWAEGVLAEAVSGQPHPEMFDLFLEYLGRLETCPNEAIGAHLVHGLYQLLQVSGVAPVVTICGISGRYIYDEAAGFSLTLGGLVATECIQEGNPVYRLTREQVSALQWLAQPELPADSLGSRVWLSLEGCLRRYLESYLQRSIRSATLLEVCFQN